MCLLFGGEVRMEGEARSGRLDVDGWVPFKIGGARREYSCKLMLEFRKALERVLQRAYASLADLGGDRGGDVGEGGGDGDGCGEEREGVKRTRWTDDPVRERFAERVVQVLDGGMRRRGLKDGAAVGVRHDDIAGWKKGEELRSSICESWHSEEFCWAFASGHCA